MAYLNKENKSKPTVPIEFSNILECCEEFGISAEIILTFIDQNSRK